MKQNKKKTKRAQEEMVGFVLIVVLVAVIAVVFLGISLRKGSDNFSEKSAELGSFLSAVSYYTTGCEIPKTEFVSLERLVKACNSRELCADSRSTCAVLRETFAEILESTYIVEEGSSVKYYRLEIFTGTETDKREVIGLIENSATGETLTCSGNKIYNSKILNTDNFNEEITIYFEVCSLEH